MTNKIAMGTAFLVLAHGLSGCSGSRSSPSSPSAVLQPPPPPVPSLIVFTDKASGFSTPDLRDAQEQIVQFNTAAELIWTADGTRLPGFRHERETINAEASCRCWLVVHFGIMNGERRAYLTADYIHDNPGTVVSLAIADRALIVSRTNVYPPGTYTLTGVVTELTPTGPTPLEGAGVWRLNDEDSGWRVGTTDKNGFYEIHGLYDGSKPSSVIKEGYETARGTIVVNGDTRFDSQLVRR